MHLAAILQPKLRYLGLDEGMICLDKLRQAYMLAALNTKETHVKQNKDKYNNILQYKIRDLLMIKNVDKKIKLGCIVHTKFQNYQINRYKPARSPQSDW